jgi:hypothetical protein
MIRYACVIVAIIAATSCVTVFSPRNVGVTIVTSELADITLNGEVVPSGQKITLQRGRKPLEIVAKTDSIENRVVVKPQTAILFWANLYFNYGIGMLVDSQSPKRSVYPRTIFIDMSKANHEYLKYLPFYQSGKKHIIKATPLKLFGSIYSSSELAFEIANNSRFSTQITGSYLFPESVWHGNIAHDVSGGSLALEQRYYWRKDALSGFYSAIEGRYFKSEYNTSEDFINPSQNQNGSPVYTDSYFVDKQAGNAHLKIGYQMIRKSFVFDAYFGLGATYKNIKIFERQDLSDKLAERRYFDFANTDYMPGKIWTVSIPFNFKLGYAF